MIKQWGASTVVWLYTAAERPASAAARESYGVDRDAGGHCTEWKIAEIGRSAARFVGPLAR